MTTSHFRYGDNSPVNYTSMNKANFNSQNLPRMKGTTDDRGKATRQSANVFGVNESVMARKERFQSTSAIDFKALKKEG